MQAPSPPQGGRILLLAALWAAQCSLAEGFSVPLHASALALQGSGSSCTSAVRYGGCRLGRGIRSAAFGAGGRGLGRGDAAREKQEAGGDEMMDFNTALRQTGLLVAAAVAFGASVWAVQGPESGLEWFTGYLLEESLSVDNLFVFILLFDYFKVESPRLQKRVLQWGLIGAVVLRAAFIFAGIVAIEKFRPILLVFAVFLVFSSVKILAGGSSESKQDLSENQIVSWATSMIKSTDEYDGDKFFTNVEGVKRATPLFLVLACIELSDIVFAIDSIPAIFGVTKDPFIILTSNFFAIVGLRGLYSVINKLMSEIVYLEKSVALVLGFIGGKMVAEYSGVEISQAVSLGAVATILSGGIALSYAAPPVKKDDE